LQAAHGKGSNRRKRENNVLFLKFIHLWTVWFASWVYSIFC
jgi:hypothetical protein